MGNLKQALVRFLALPLFLFLLTCTDAPTDSYLASFQSDFGNIEDIEELIFEEKFTDLSRWTGGQHFYDFRSGYYKESSTSGMSPSPTLLSDGGIRLTYDTGAWPAGHNRFTGLRLNSALAAFKPSPGKSIVIRFKASVKNATGPNGHHFNKVIFTLTQGGTLSTWTEGAELAKSAATLCETETVGQGIALVLENAETSTGTFKKFIRVERQTGSIPNMEKYSGGSCGTPPSKDIYRYANTLYASSAGSNMANSEVSYTNAGPYMAFTKRFVALNPSEYPQEITAVSVASGGSGYANGNTLVVNGGTKVTGGSDTDFTVANQSGGSITSVSLNTIGAFTSLPTSPNSVTGGAGTGASLNFSFSSPPVSSTQYAQRDISSITLEDITNYVQNEITIDSTSKITWKIAGQTYTFTEFVKEGSEPGFDFDSGFSYVSIKMQQDGLGGDSAAIPTRVKDLVISLKND